mmetsp:Transcript_10614/g.14871  ORF Transcript_10614/g.14871 Transcript_10614/m.14871 type:complete len:259 (-) Transcript_10614:269-1045(-)|eukprot:CAMPEP_0185731776 /NCGR_PEP_ID=MMETSP1171-20130828/13916_1 /TAXON_ID=374046 /ORGANISM="Helicotheca tamensis, Strain CCMP826" /LENGTH=258 /DNA_ID=CAMNT_0028401103 /DNA_START=156 /DNA_END=932 /DNA_ORIENTATION=+
MKLQLSILLLGFTNHFVTPFVVVPPSTWGSPSTKKQSPIILNEVIKGEAVDGQEFDEGLGGVRLAMESAIKIIGTLQKSSPSKVTDIGELLRYTKVTEFQMDDVKDAMENSGVTVICTGTGKELYKDPGTSTVKEVEYAPTEAAKAALSSVPAASLSNSKNVVLNFIGGDELILNEVLDGATELLDGLDVGSKAKVAFNSLCDSSFPATMASVTVVAAGSDGKESGEGVSGSIANGEMYFHQGKWWTVVKEDINPAKV